MTSPTVAVIITSPVVPVVDSPDAQGWESSLGAAKFVAIGTAPFGLAAAARKAP